MVEDLISTIFYISTYPTYPIPTQTQHVLIPQHKLPLCFLSRIYNSYKNNLRLEVEASLKLKRDLLRRSFESLNLLPAVSTTGDSSNLGNSFMSKDAFKNLMKWTAPDRNEEFLEVCWLILDYRNQRCISFDEFSHVPELMDMRIVNIHDKRNVWFPEVYHNTWSKMLIRCIRHIYFRYLFDVRTTSLNFFVF